MTTLHSCEFSSIPACSIHVIDLPLWACSRFLRARRFDPRKAEKQFSDTAEWRKKNDVDNLYANFDVEEFESTRRYYPRWTGRRDKVCRISAYICGVDSYLMRDNFSKDYQYMCTSCPPCQITYKKKLLQYHLKGDTNECTRIRSYPLKHS